MRKIFQLLLVLSILIITSCKEVKENSGRLVQEIGFRTFMIYRHDKSASTKLRISHKYSPRLITDNTGVVTGVRLVLPQPELGPLDETGKFKRMDKLIVSMHSAVPGGMKRSWKGIIERNPYQGKVFEYYDQFSRGNRGFFYLKRDGIDKKDGPYLSCVSIDLPVRQCREYVKLSDKLIVRFRIHIGDMDREEYIRKYVLSLIKKFIVEM